MSRLAVFAVALSFRLASLAALAACVWLRAAPGEAGPAPLPAAPEISTAG